MSRQRLLIFLKFDDFRDVQVGRSERPVVWFGRGLIGGGRAVNI